MRGRDAVVGGEGRAMKLFLDTADLGEIRELAATGLLDGVTTNPSLVKKAGKDFLRLVEEVAGLVAGPVSAETVATDHETMLAEGRKLAGIASNIAVKVPLTGDGLKTCRVLAGEGVPVNVTLCFSPVQALLAAKAGAGFVSPFVGRQDDTGVDGMDMIGDIRTIFDNYGFSTEILVASVRHPAHVLQAARIGADVATLPAPVMRKLFQHPLTDTGLEAFLEDWAETGQSIL